MTPLEREKLFQELFPPVKSARGYNSNNFRVPPTITYSTSVLKPNYNPPAISGATLNNNNNNNKHGFNAHHAGCGDYVILTRVDAFRGTGVCWSE